MRQFILPMVLSFSLQSAFAAGEEELSFRGVTPGATVAEVKAQVKKIRGFTIARGTMHDTPVCDAVYRIVPNAILSALSGMASGLDSSHSSVEPVVPTIAGQEVKGNALFFVRSPEDGQLRLVTIVVEFNANNFETVLSELTKKYGDPARCAVTDVQNGIGNHFENSRYEWRSGQTKMTAERYYGKISESAVTYTNMPLDDARAIANRMRPVASDL